MKDNMTMLIFMWFLLKYGVPLEWSISGVSHACALIMVCMDVTYEMFIFYYQRDKPDIA